MMPIQKRYSVEAIAYINTNFNLNTYVEENTEDWDTLWIFKHLHILDVIKSLKQQALDSKVEHWMLGKLFGYEEEAISNFLSKC